MNVNFLFRRMDQDVPSPVQFGLFDGGDTGTGVGGVGGITVEAVFMWGTEMAFAIDGVYDSGFGGIFDGPFPAANSVVVDMVCEHFGCVRGGRSIVLYILWNPTCVGCMSCHAICKARIRGHSEIVPPQRELI